MQPEVIYRRRWWTLIVLSLSLLVISLDNTILNVALPSLSADLDASSSELSWIVDSYMLVFAGLLLTAGALGDRFGRRRALAGGLVVFAAGSLAATFAGSSEALIASRALMGLGAAFIMPSTLSILTAVFPAGERAKAIGIWAAVSGLGIAIGPVTGGFLLEHFSWASVFLVNVPFVIAALLMMKFLVPESRDSKASPLDPVGAGLSIAGLASLLWAIIEAPSKGWTSVGTLIAFGLAGVLLAAFVAWELRTRYPMLDVRLFRNRRFSGASAAISLTFFGLFGTIFFLTTYLQEVLGYTPLEAGYRVVPVALGIIAASALSARLTGRLGTKAMVAGGLATVASGLFLLSTVSLGSGYPLVAAVLLIMGAGMGLAMAPATDSVMGSLPLAKASVGSAMNDTTRMVGGALGVAILGSLLSSGYRSEVEPATTSLPAPAADAAGDTLTGALGVAGQLGGETGRALSEASQAAFVSGMGGAALVAAAVTLAGSLVALFLLPSREAAAPVVELPAGPLEPEALAA